MSEEKGPRADYINTFPYKRFNDVGCLMSDVGDYFLSPICSSIFLQRWTSSFTNSSQSA